MTTKKIIIIIPSLGSFNAFLKEQAQALIDDKWEITLLTRKGNKVNRIQGLSIIDINIPRGTNIIGYFISALKIRSIIKKIQPDLVHAHFSTAAILLALAKNSNTSNYLATIQGVIYTVTFGLKAKIYRSIEVFAFKHLDKVWVLTKDDQSVLLKDGTYVFCQQSYGFGCNLTIFNPRKYTLQDKSLLRQDLNLTNQDKIIIFIGRLVYFKGIQIAFRAFKKALLEIPELKFLICGNLDPLHSSGLSETEIAEISNHTSVRWMGHTSRIPEYLSISDINVFPSIREGMPVNLMESIAMGVPVITHNSRGCRDVVWNGKTGIVLPELNPESYAKEIIKLIKDRDKLKLFRNNALEIRHLFDRQLYIDEMNAAYQHIIDN
jgi:glycosyltransferase involved in cell wall biosynthesis